MFVVMRTGATEAEVIGVKGLILAEGLTPFENAGDARIVIAVVGEIGRRREQLTSRLEAQPGVDRVTAISKPYKLVSREFHPRGHGHPGARRGDRRRLADGDGRAVLDREPRAAAGDRRRTSRPTARRSSAAGRSSRAPARTASRAWASRGCATSPRRASGPACRSSPRSWSRARSTSWPSTPTSSRSAPATCRTSRCCSPAGARAGR